MDNNDRIINVHDQFYPICSDRTIIVLIAMETIHRIILAITLIRLPIVMVIHRTWITETETGLHLDKSLFICIQRSIMFFIICFLFWSYHQDPFAGPMRRGNMAGSSSSSGRAYAPYNNRSTGYRARDGAGDADNSGSSWTSWAWNWLCNMSSTHILCEFVCCYCFCFCFCFLLLLFPLYCYVSFHMYIFTLNKRRDWKLLDERTSYNWNAKKNIFSHRHDISDDVDSPKQKLSWIIRIVSIR